MAAEAVSDQVRQRVERIVKEIGELSESEVDRPTFYARLLERVVEILQSAGGAIWELREKEVALQCQHELRLARITDDPQQKALFERAIGEMRQRAVPVVVSGREAHEDLVPETAKAGWQNQSPNPLLFFPLTADQGVAAVLLLIEPANLAARMYREHLGFLAGVARQTKLFLQGDALRRLRQQVENETLFTRYQSTAHSTLDPERICYAVANFAKEFIGVDRCSVGSAHKGKIRIHAVSGVESVVHRSETNQRHERVCTRICRSGQPFHYVAEQLEARAETLAVADEVPEYMAQGGIGSTYILPLHHQETLVGVLCVEQVEPEEFTEAQLKKIEQVAAVASSAMGNALTYRDIPFSRLVRALAQLRDWLRTKPSRKRVIYAGLAVALLAWMVLVRGNLKVNGDCRLRMVGLSGAYSQVTGVVKDVVVRTGDTVKAGQMLANLENPELEARLVQARAELAQAQHAFRAAQEKGDLALRRDKQLAVRVHQAEVDFLQARLKSFVIRAPRAGVVATENLHLLTGKPVERGEPLFEIIPQHEEMELVMNVPEAEAGPILNAWATRKGQLDAVYILNAYPSQKLSTTVKQVAPSAKISDGQNVITVRLVLSGEGASMQLRPGMEGKAAVVCERRAYGYLYFHGFVSTVRRALF